MNVLVYDGPGVSQTSHSYTISTLKSILNASYAVQSVSPKVLATEPWTKSCALLVIPGGRDLPYLSALEPAMKTIKTYVQNGGSYLGFCAGAYFASGRVEWEVGTPLEVKGDRPLKFFPGLSHGCTYPGFRYESEDGARVVSIVSPDGRKQTGLYYNGGGEFVMPDPIAGVKPLAYYDDDPDGRSGMLAGVACDVRNGKAVLWHVHLEYPSNSDLAIAAAARSASVLNAAELLKSEEDRQLLLRETLSILRLDTSSQKEAGPVPPAKPLPQFLCASAGSQHQLEATLEVLRALQEKNSALIIDAEDQFEIHEATSSDSIPSILPQEEHAAQTRHVIVFQGKTPSSQLTPYFSLQSYFDHLAKALSKYGASVPKIAPLQSSIGEVLIYGEAVTSTQTLLQSNIKTLEHLPVPLLSLATYQLSGRGRGSNVWVSPLGCLQWSLFLRPPTTFPNNKLVFIQYLVGLAVVRASREVLGTEMGKRVVLKWPNDVYAKTKEEELKKIGGILINTVFMAGGVRIIAGCGVNVLNAPPIFSLSQLSSSTPPETLTMENMAATIMAVFGQMWDEFVAAKGSFEPFMEDYLDSWIHSDQLVTLEMTTPPTKVRIVGITPEHGLLRTVPEYDRHAAPGRSGEAFIDLQPDGNSFDMMAGLIRTKR